MNVMWRQVKKERRPKAKGLAIPDFHLPTKKAVFPSLTLTQCVEELLLIAINSSSNCISTRVNVTEAYVQVVDNGVGINERDIHKIGERTPLVDSVGDARLNKKAESPWYGSGAEAILSMIGVSEKVEIVSRSSNADDDQTFSKTFICGIGTVEKLSNERPCDGTTATVHNLFHKTPVRKKKLNESKELGEVLLLVQGLAVSLAGKISISLRDDEKGKVLINTSKMKSPKESVLGVFGIGYCKSLHTLKGSCGNVQISAVLSTEAYAGKKAKIISLNHRQIFNRRIQQSIDMQLKMSKIAVDKADNADSPGGKPKHYFYCIDILCDRSMYTLCRELDRTTVEFHNWQALLNSIYKIIKKFLILHKVYKPDAPTLEITGSQAKGDNEGSKSAPASSQHKSTDQSVQLVDCLKARQSASKENAAIARPVSEATARDSAEIDIGEVLGIKPVKKSSRPVNRAPTQMQMNWGLSHWPPPADKQLPHVVYWLLKHVPDRVPRLESQHKVDTVPYTQMSMYPHPGSSHHSSKLSDYQLQLSINSGHSIHKRSADSFTAPTKRRKVTTSFNKGEPSKSVFASKLKIHPANDENFNYQRHVNAIAAVLPNRETPKHHSRREPLADSAEVFLRRCQHKRYNRESWQFPGATVKVQERHDATPYMPVDVRCTPKHRSANIAMLGSCSAPMRLHNIADLPEKRKTSRSSTDIFMKDQRVKEPRYPLKPITERERYFATYGMGAQQDNQMPNPTNVTFRGDMTGHDSDIFGEQKEDSNSDRPGLSGIPAIDRIFNESKSRDGWSFESTDKHPFAPADMSECADLNLRTYLNRRGQKTETKQRNRSFSNIFDPQFITEPLACRHVPGTALATLTSSTSNDSVSGCSAKLSLNTSSNNTTELVSAINNSQSIACKYPFTNSQLSPAKSDIVKNCLVQNLQSVSSHSAEVWASCCSSNSALCVPNCVKSGFDTSEAASENALSSPANTGAKYDNDDSESKCSEFVSEMAEEGPNNAEHELKKVESDSAITESSYENVQTDYENDKLGPNIAKIGSQKPETQSKIAEKDSDKVTNVPECVKSESEVLETVSVMKGTQKPHTTACHATKGFCASGFHVPITATEEHSQKIDEAIWTPLFAVSKEHTQSHCCDTVDNLTKTDHSIPPKNEIFSPIICGQSVVRQSRSHFDALNSVDAKLIVSNSVQCVEPSVCKPTTPLSGELESCSWSKHGVNCKQVNQTVAFTASSLISSQNTIIMSKRPSSGDLNEIAGNDAGEHQTREITSLASCRQDENKMRRQSYFASRNGSPIANNVKDSTLPVQKRSSNNEIDANCSIGSGWSEIVSDIKWTRAMPPLTKANSSDQRPLAGETDLLDVQDNQVTSSHEPMKSEPVSSSNKTVSTEEGHVFLAGPVDTATDENKLGEDLGGKLSIAVTSSKINDFVKDGNSTDAVPLVTPASTSLTAAGAEPAHLRTLGPPPADDRVAYSHEINNTFSFASLMSSFTSEELNFLNDELLDLRPTCKVTNNDGLAEQMVPPALYVDKKSGNTYYHTDIPQENDTPAGMRTPLQSSTFSFQCGKTPYTTPRSFPSLQSLVGQQKDDFIPFNKELLAPLYSKKPLVLTPDLLVKPSVIGQWGKQIILLICKTSKPGDEVILAVDQHAAHERVRVELLAAKYIDKSGQVLRSSLSPPHLMNVSKGIYDFLSEPGSLSLLAKHGICITLGEGNTVSVTAVPLAISLYCVEHTNYLQTYVQSVIIELMERGSTAILISKYLQDVINSQSCRGAIKFGDELTKAQCVAVINRLSRCKLPFQCAHGRPSCIPIYNMTALTKAFQIHQTKAPKLSKLRLKRKD